MAHNAQFAAAVLAAWPEAGARVLAIIRDQAWRDHPAVVEWAARCYHDPRENPRAAPECKLLAISAEIGGFGVEVIRGREVDRYYGDIQASYVNLGDTYDLTILYDSERSTWRVTSWGDWVERFGEVREVA